MFCFCSSKHTSDDESDNFTNKNHTGIKGLPLENCGHQTQANVESVPPERTYEVLHIYMFSTVQSICHTLGVLESHPETRISLCLISGVPAHENNFERIL